MRPLEQFVKRPMFAIAVTARVAPGPRLTSLRTALSRGRWKRTGRLVHALRTAGLTTYKTPARFIELTEFPRVGGNEIDKKRLLDMAPAA